LVGKLEEIDCEINLKGRRGAKNDICIEQGNGGGLGVNNSSDSIRENKGIDQ
jgi:hypothetical protein